MIKSKKTSEVMLNRDDWTIQLDMATWSEILVFLNDKGCKPSVLLTSFLGNNEVSDFEAMQINSVGQKVLDQALRNPSSVYPVSFDMGKFAEIISFCEDGAFNISRTE